MSLIEESRDKWKKGSRNSSKFDRCSFRVLWQRDDERACGRRGRRIGGERGGRRAGGGGTATISGDIDGEFLASLTVPWSSTDEVVSTRFVEGHSRRWSGVSGKRRGWVARIKILLRHFLYVVSVRSVVEHCKTQTIEDVISYLLQALIKP